MFPVILLERVISIAIFRQMLASLCERLCMQAHTMDSSKKITHTECYSIVCRKSLF